LPWYLLQINPSKGTQNDTYFSDKSSNYSSLRQTFFLEKTILLSKMRKCTLMGTWFRAPLLFRLHIRHLDEKVALSRLQRRPYGKTGTVQSRSTVPPAPSNQKRISQIIRENISLLYSASNPAALEKNLLPKITSKQQLAKAPRFFAIPA
jgi:hypothetical protein